MQAQESEKYVDIQAISVRRVEQNECSDFKALMQQHHYLGALPKIGETIWYVATLHGKWIALLSFSSAALKCSVRDQWIGWSFRHQYDRLHLITNNSRFLIFPDWHRPNVASRVLSLCQKRLPSDWMRTFHHPLLLVETFVDPSLFEGTIYKAANWRFLGHTKGFQRTRGGYAPHGQSAKMVFVYPLQANAQSIMSKPVLNKNYRYGRPKIMLSPEHMQALPDFFSDIPDPRRGQGLRHSLQSVIAITIAATLCGAKSYSAISEWAQNLGQKGLARFRCRWVNGIRIPPSTYVIRDLMVRVDPDALGHALQRWNEVYGEKDESLAIDGKTMCGAVDGNGLRTHIMSAVGHHTMNCYAQKKLASSRSREAMSSSRPMK